jgi:hypothetical protein
MNDVNINFKSGQIEVKGPFGSIFLYTHDDVHKLVDVVSNILSKRIRWDDPDYLSRILFCKLIPVDKFHTETGYGIGVQAYDDVRMIITVDTVNLRVRISEYDSVGGVICRGLHYSFEEFIENFTKEAEL